MTETLKSVPGFWVEASGGEGSGNVRARGIPVDGFGSINLLEDGLPVQHDPALGYLNADQAFRIDESIDRIEVVRGGPSSVFYSSAPGGVVNYITRKPGDTLSGNARILYGPTAELYRFDGWIGTPLADGWKLGLGGFYRNEVALAARSRMNIPFFLPDDKLNDAFLAGAKAQGLLQLKGHKSVGGMRASIYNAVDINAVNALVAYMAEFEKEHG